VADPVAIVSVVSGATVAITVPFINGLLERKRVQQQSRDARFDELRVLLDGAVQDLYRALAILFDIEEERLKELPGPDWSPKRLRQLGDRLTKVADEIVQDGLRVSLRTPAGASISAAHKEAEKVFLEYEGEYRTYLRGGLIDQERPPEAPIHSVGRTTTVFIDAIRDFAGVVTPRPAPGQTSS
jgi:hypothetical protein